MGQDSEEAAEFVATVRGEHVAMKTWYNESAAAQAVRDKYGSQYPSLWKDVLNWTGWKETRREYLKSVDSGSNANVNTRDSNPSEEQRSAKRKSRWGSSAASETNNNKRQSRWGRDNDPGPAGTSAPALPGLVLPGMASTPELVQLQARLREINDKMVHLVAEAERVDALPPGHRERSPSPPPVYGPDGKRKNTRAVRWRERYTAERQDIMERIMRINGAASGSYSQGSNLLVRKRTKKIRIPIEEHPNYNFIGLIIGPRGKTQKDLEAKTGCKIAIRGRGSVKEGARGRRDGKVMEGDNEPLHVVVTGDDQRAVDAAADMVEQMLVVIDDERNVHKQQQLRELALLNGTLKEEEFCTICGEKGHRPFECPRRVAMNKPTMKIKCAICGDTSHPTRDCTKVPTAEPKNEKELDSDYTAFMAELDGKKAQSASTGAASKTAEVKPIMGPAGSLPPPPPSNVAPPGAPPVVHLPPPPQGGPLGAPPSFQQQQQQPPPPNMYASAPPPRTAADHSGNYYGSQQQYQQPHHPGGYHQPQQHHRQPYQGAPGQYPLHSNAGQQQPSHHQQQQYGQQQQQQQPQQQPPRQVRPGEETAAWDPNAFYGAGQYDANGGAGGFNWWEQ